MSKITQDHQNILVASANGDGLYNFHRHQSTSQKNHLQLHQHIPMPQSLDNLSWNQSHNELWITAHSHPLRFLLHGMSSTIESPTVIYSTHFNIKDQRLSDIQVEMGEGLPISGGSITVKNKQKVWVGSVFEDFILQCTL